MNETALFPTPSPTVFVEVSSLSAAQEKILILLTLFSCSLSIFGSSTIVYKVLHRKNVTPYDRLMLGLSTCDIICSASLGLSPFLVPAATSPRYWALGNDATCSMMGWFFQFSFSAIWYNGMLSYYYLLTIRFGVKREDFGRKYEIWMHALTWIWSLGTATYGSAIGLYHELEVGFGCWTNDFPEGCEATDSCTSYYYGWVMGALPSIFMWLSLVVNNLVIVLYVRRMLGSDREYADELAERQAKQVREVAIQGYLYVGTFILSYWAAIAVRLFESAGYTYADESDFFIFLVLMAIFQPLQGFFNVLVYNKPNYYRVRQAFPDLTRLEAMQMACLHSDIPLLRNITRGSSNSNVTGTHKTASVKPNVAGSGGSGDKQPTREITPIQEEDDDLSLSDHFADNFYGPMGSQMRSVQMRRVLMTGRPMGARETPSNIRSIEKDSEEEKR
eukprot:Nitzschia sp. Nitz4//scaffold22_size323478//10633//11970//NITZ4_000490-RA/size323478-processed-gene-0.434-mRNA-1//-1//CDS//3329542884//1262//frame0